MNFSVGYNGSFSDLQRIIKSSGKVNGVYTGGVKNMISGGRQQYADSLDVLSEQIEFAHDHGVSFELTLNAPCNIPGKEEKEWWKKIRKYLKEIEKRDVDAVTVSHPFIMNEVKSHTNLKLSVSTICEIMTARSALFYEDLGADVIVPSMNINHNLKELELMKKSLKSAQIRIMLNEHCLGDCPWRRFHHNYFAHNNTADYNFLYNCRDVYRRNWYVLLVNNVVRPEDLTYYKNITNNFKIVGRLVPIDDLEIRIKAYAEQSFNGNYVNLSDSQISKIVHIPNKELRDLFREKSECTKICSDCNYCITLFKQVAKVRRFGGKNVQQ